MKYKKKKKGKILALYGFYKVAQKKILKETGEVHKNLFYHVVYTTEYTGADEEILKKGTLCRPSWLADEETFRFQMV